MAFFHLRLLNIATSQTSSLYWFAWTLEGADTPRPSFQYPTEAPKDDYTFSEALRDVSFQRHSEFPEWLSEWPERGWVIPEKGSVDCIQLSWGIGPTEVGGLFAEQFTTREKEIVQLWHTLGKSQGMVSVWAENACEIQRELKVLCSTTQSNAPPPF